MGYYCAIDLGTTNTVFAYGMINPRNGNIEAKTLKMKMKSATGGIETSQLVPSCVFIENINEKEIIPVVGPYAKHMASINPQNVVRSVKSSMGTDRIYEMASTKFSPSDISSFILKFVLNNAKELFKSMPDDVVITVPASFDSDMRLATIEAAKNAGIKTVNEDGTERNILLDEPRAALFNFVRDIDMGNVPETVVDLSSPKNILVYDLGGGTLDVSLHKVWRDENQKVKIEDYAISLHTLVGGDNFDSKIAEYLYSKIEKQVSRKNLNEFEKNRLFSVLLNLAEKAKIEIAEKELNNAMMGIDEEVYAEVVQANIVDDIALDEVITKSDYEKIVSDILANELTLESADSLRTSISIESKNIIYPVLDVMAKAKEKSGKDVKVDAILLNGGMTKLSIIKSRLQRLFDLKPISMQDPDLSVACGGVYYHYELHNGTKFQKILNDSIGIETNGQHVEHLAKAGVTLPYRSKVYDNFTIPQTGTNVIHFPIYIGSRNDTLRPNRKIAERFARFDKSLNAGDKVSVQVEINESGILSLKGFINNNENDRFVFEVDSNKKEEFADSGSINPKPSRQISYKDTFENPVSKSSIKTLKNLCKNVVRVKDNNSKATFFKQIKDVEGCICRCTDKNNAVNLLVSEISTYQEDLFVQRAVFIIGNLMKSTGLNNAFLDYSKKELNPMVLEVTYSPQKFLNKRFIIEALGKTEDSRCEEVISGVFNASHQMIKPIIESALISLGKTGTKVSSFNEITGFLSSSETRQLISALWSFGKIASRSKQKPLGIKDIEPYIPQLVRIAKNHNHACVLHNCIYALVESCDSRYNGEKVSPATKNSVANLFEYVQKKYSYDLSFMRLVDVAKKALKGESLNSSEEKVLLDIRNNVSIND